MSTKIILSAIIISFSLVIYYLIKTNPKPKDIILLKKKYISKSGKVKWGKQIQKEDNEIWVAPIDDIKI